MKVKLYFTFKGETIITSLSTGFFIEAQYASWNGLIGALFARQQRVRHLYRETARLIPVPDLSTCAALSLRGSPSPSHLQVDMTIMMS